MEAGLTRGNLPNPERDTGQGTDARIRNLQQRLAEQNRKLDRARKQAESRPAQPERKPGEERAAALESLANSEFGSLAGDGSFRPLRIVHVALHDVTGGAARAAYGLHTGLRNLGHDSSMFVANRRSEDPSVQAFKPPTDPERGAARRARREEFRLEFERYEETRPDDLIGYGFTGDRSVHGSDTVEQLPPCDVVNLHWFGDFLDYRAFFSTVPRHMPVVWTLHDMNAFTGGCHWDAGCGKFTDSCGACPQLGSTDENDLSRQNWRRKHEAFSSIEPGGLHLVSPSNGLAEEARRSSLLGEFPLQVIPYGMDIQTFAPRDRKLSRSALGIPQDATVLLFIADSLVTVRKGFSLLVEALNGLKDTSNVVLVSLGQRRPEITEKVTHVHLGHVVDDLLISSIYSAADLLAVPSLQDNLPLTALEALCCGTPIVSFDTGGMPDIVRPGVTGELVPVGDVRALRQTINALLRNPEKLAKMSENCRRIAVEEISQPLQASRYVELYRSITQARTGARVR